jgi:hypothetical protein
VVGRDLNLRAPRPLPDRFGAMSERRGGPTDLFAVEGQRAYQRSMMVEAGFLGVRSRRSVFCSVSNPW